MPPGSNIAAFAVLIGTVITLALIIFVSREFWLWYLRINRMVDYFEAQTRLLYEIHKELVTFRNERNRFRKTA